MLDLLGEATGEPGEAQALQGSNLQDDDRQGAERQKTADLRHSIEGRARPLVPRRGTRKPRITPAASGG